MTGGPVAVGLNHLLGVPLDLAAGISVPAACLEVEAKISSGLGDDIANAKAFAFLLDLESEYPRSLTQTGAGCGSEPLIAAPWPSATSAAA